MNFQEITETYIADIFKSLNLDNLVTTQTAVTANDIKDASSKEKGKNS